MSSRGGSGIGSGIGGGDGGSGGAGNTLYWGSVQQASELFNWCCVTHTAQRVRNIERTAEPNIINNKKDNEKASGHSSESPYDPLTGGRSPLFSRSLLSAVELWATESKVLVVRGSVVVLISSFCCVAVCGLKSGGRVALTFERLCHDEQLGGNLEKIGGFWCPACKIAY